ncbi:MAG: hypothetical protein M0R22_01000 [Dehalococcoidia bacterium]|jgi:hypothetical protein|nr:hypothetical protein [Dehalococcoidia bacterium]
MPIREARGIVCTVSLDEELKILTEARADTHRIVERLKLLYGMQPKFGDKEYFARFAAANAGGFLFDLIHEVEQRIAEVGMTRDEEVILLGAARNGDDGQDRPGDAPERW